MEDRPSSLIQRAAARLRDGQPRQRPETTVDGNTPERQETGKWERPISPSAEPRRRDARGAREVVVDRGRMVREGIALPSSDSRTAEEFRVIKRQILRMASRDAAVEGDCCTHMIVVTSAQAGEGKTFTAVNLALGIAAEQDWTVLLIDGDIQRQTLPAIMGIDVGQGLVDLLSDVATDPSDVLVRTDIPGLSILPAGTRDRYTPELLSSRRMRTLMKDVTQRYPDRFIIVDAPPCLVSSDSSSLAALAHQIVFVVEADRTQRDEIEGALSLISSCPNISLVLNKTRFSSAEQLGSYAVGESNL